MVTCETDRFVAAHKAAGWILVNNETMGGGGVVEGNRGGGDF
jgi:hypothetical protein